MYLIQLDPNVAISPAVSKADSPMQNSVPMHGPVRTSLHAGRISAFHDKTAFACIVYQRLRVRLGGHFCAVSGTPWQAR